MLIFDINAYPLIKTNYYGNSQYNETEYAIGEKLLITSSCDP